VKVKPWWLGHLAIVEGTEALRKFNESGDVRLNRGSDSREKVQFEQMSRAGRQRNLRRVNIGESWM